MVAGISQGTGGVGQFFSKLLGARSDASGHQIFRIWYDFLSFQCVLAASCVIFEKFMLLIG